ncbi:hypothetical protein [Nocardioides bruguierae]|nr:hypothetical protein [Nocardioides bruguierae]
MSTTETPDPLVALIEAHADVFHDGECRCGLIYTTDQREEGYGA